MNKTEMDVRSTVDKIGDLKAQMAALQEQLDPLQNKLKGWGAGNYPGFRYDANVSVSERDTLDMAAVRAKLSAQFIRANTNTTSVVALRVTARKQQLAA